MSSKKIKKIEQYLASSLKNIEAIPYMLKGSYGVTHNRCGKPNCWCAEPEAGGHPSHRVTWNDDGAFYSRNIPKNDREWVKQAVENYKLFRGERRQIRLLCQKLQIEVDSIGMKMIKKTRSKKTYFKKFCQSQGDVDEQNEENGKI
jgi:hypothetical protein